MTWCLVLVNECHYLGEKLQGKWAGSKGGERNTEGTGGYLRETTTVSELTLRGKRESSRRSRPKDVHNGGNALEHHELQGVQWRRERMLRGGNAGQFTGGEPVRITQV